MLVIPSEKLEHFTEIVEEVIARYLNP